MELREDGLRNFSAYYHYMVDDVVDYRFIRGGYQLLLMNDGRVYLYDDMCRSLRRLPLDPYNMTEEECRIEFGEALDRIMRVKRVTQYELSRRTGISQASLSNYIQCKVSPSFHVVDKIAKALDVSIEEFRYTGF